MTFDSYKSPGWSLVQDTPETKFIKCLDLARTVKSYAATEREPVVEPKLKFEAVGVVFLGSFNPQIFQPAWFAAEKLIRKEEAEAAKIQVIHPEVTAFSLEWATLQVTHEHLRADTTTEQQFSPEFLRDLTVGTFRLLSHTPIKQMGLNRVFHFEIESEEVWHAIGHRLVPKKDWEGILQRPGTRVVAVEGTRPDGYKGRILVRLGPSTKFHPGIYALVNDHFEQDENDTRTGAGPMLEIMEKHWQESLERSRKIVYDLMSRIV